MAARSLYKVAPSRCRLERRDAQGAESAVQRLGLSRCGVRAASPGLTIRVAPAPRRPRVTSLDLQKVRPRPGLPSWGIETTPGSPSLDSIAVFSSNSERITTLGAAETTASRDGAVPLARARSAGPLSRAQRRASAVDSPRVSPNLSCARAQPRRHALSLVVVRSCSS